MASAAEVSTRSDRLVVLVTRSEKSAIVARAKKSGMTLSEYVRAASIAAEPGQAIDRSALDEISVQVTALRGRLEAAFDRVDRYLGESVPLDEEAIRERIIADLETRNLDWSAIRRALAI